jgi:hypothetical protein
MVILPNVSREKLMLCRGFFTLRIQHISGMQNVVNIRQQTPANMFSNLIILSNVEVYKYSHSFSVERNMFCGNLIRYDKHITRV